MRSEPAFAIERSSVWAVSGWSEATPTRVPGGSWARLVGLKFPGKVVELLLAALHQEDLGVCLGNSGMDPGQAQDAHRYVVGGHPHDRGPDHHFLEEGLAEGRGGEGRTCTYPARFRSSMARATVASGLLRIILQFAIVN